MTPKEATALLAGHDLVISKIPAPNPSHECVGPVGMHFEYDTDDGGLVVIHRDGTIEAPNKTAAAEAVEFLLEQTGLESLITP